MEGNMGEVETDVEYDAALESTMMKVAQIHELIDQINEERISKILHLELDRDLELKGLYANRSEITNSIPSLWLIALSKHPVLKSFIKDDDLKILSYLTSLEVDEEFVENVKIGYSITFKFESNPFFENPSLKKAFRFIQKGTAEITATPIQWKEEHIGSNEVGHKKKLDMTPAHDESFFTWFSCAYQKLRIEDFEDIEDRIGDSIREDLWPNLLSYIRAKHDKEDADEKVPMNGNVKFNQYGGLMFYLDKLDEMEKVPKKSKVESNQVGYLIHSFEKVQKIQSEIEKVPKKHEVENNLIHSFEKVLKIQSEIEKIEENAIIQALDVEKIYNARCKELYDRRSEIIKTVPDFWYIAFLSHPFLSSFISVEDEEILKHFTSLDVEHFNDVYPGYSITFYFEPNPYIDNTKLTRTFKFLNQGTKITTTPIKWKESMVCNVDGEKKQEIRFTTNESFFSLWFKDAEPGYLWRDFEDVIADVIKEEIWPNPLSYSF